MRYTLNELKNSFEVGTTSNWIIYFEDNDLNKIKSKKGNSFPALDVDIEELIVKEKTITVGPDIHLTLPYLSAPVESIKITFIDDHLNSIFDFIKNLVNNTPLKKGVAYNYKTIKKFAKKIVIQKFDKTLSEYTEQSYLVYPGKNLTFHGDQSFNVNSNVVEFTVIGEETSKKR